ncbi:hypothetical protein ACFS27_01670 [Promicromonospora vindobonensis]|uniref:Uncharacterized protein n=1 Tax=Promicromonospora vindobonensis TaxID=195748 RepID=A0ABW5VPT9_9MICO
MAGLSAVVPLPFLGPFAPASAALRTYALTLAEAAAPDGVHVGSLVVGGLIERGDIHQLLTSGPPDVGSALSPAIAGATLDPDDLADAVWRIAAGAEREVVADVITT